jgi:ribosomal protein S18 acetylase RimI-like enzyme
VVVGEVTEGPEDTSRGQLPEVRLRRPVEADHRAVVTVVDDWWGGRGIHQLLPRLWFQHFTGTSWIAETDDGRLAGFLVGFVSPDEPTTGYVHMVAANPNLRQRGLGRMLYDAFISDVVARGVRRVRAVTWPGNRVSVGFHTALGFEIDAGRGTQRLYGTPAHPNYDGQDEDRVVFVRDVGPGP